MQGRGLERAGRRAHKERRWDPVGSLLRRAQMRTDQVLAMLSRQCLPLAPVPPFDRSPRFALLTVNFSTTRYLKLMLLTLSEQEDLDLIHRIVVVDNGSKDGGLPFLRDVSGRLGRVHLVENRLFRNHGRGLRRAVAELDRVESGLDASQRTNLMLCCDPDVIFRDPGTLRKIAAQVLDENAAFVGELRRGLYPYPEAQASFFVVRRDCYARRDVAPFVFHGAPAYWMQRSLWRGGWKVSDFPSNRGGYVLHRGRTGVAAARTFERFHPYAKVVATPHFMGVPDGARIWQEVEDRHAEWLDAGSERRLREHLIGRFAHLCE